MRTTKYQVVGNDGKLIDGPCNTVRAAVLTAAKHDGFGACFARIDEAGDINPKAGMRLYSSARHIGNNPYFPVLRDAFRGESELVADDAAMDEVAELVRQNGVLHSRYSLQILELDYSEAGELVAVDGRDLADLAAEMDTDIAAARKYYSGE